MSHRKHHTEGYPWWAYLVAFVIALVLWQPKQSGGSGRGRVR